MKRQEMIDKIKKEVEETLVKSEKLYEQEFERIPISFKIRGKRAGCFTHRGFGEKLEKAELKFNLEMAIFPENLDKDFKQTVVHEVAHYVNCAMAEHKPQKHGFEWKTVMKDLGFEPNIYHDYVTPPRVKKEVVPRIRKNLPIGEYRFPEHKTREEAKEAGDILYFNETPEFACEKGHVAPRYVRDNMCKQCSQLLRVEKDKKREDKLRAELERKIRAELAGKGKNTKKKAA